jgi:hypothetical protein
MTLEIQRSCSVREKNSSFKRRKRKRDYKQKLRQLKKLVEKLRHKLQLKLRLRLRESWSLKEKQHARH